MPISQRRKQQLAMQIAELSTYAPAGRTLRAARQCLGISRQRLAARMGIDDGVMRGYENGGIRIPGSVMLKIFMFGLDFWCERDL